MKPSPPLDDQDNEVTEYIKALCGRSVFIPDSSVTPGETTSIAAA